MLKSDKLELERSATAKTATHDGQNGKENRRHGCDGTAGSRKSPALSACGDFEHGQADVYSFSEDESE